MLLKTTKDGTGKGHYHIVYLREQDGMVSESRGHSHEIQYMPGTPEQYDTSPDSPSVGMKIAEATQPSWNIIPYEDHTHELTEYVTQSTQKREKEPDIVKDIISLYEQAKKNEESSIEDAHECESMYQHKQWDPEEKKTLEGKDRAALTINKLEEKMDNLSGYQRQNRTEFRFLPTEEGDQKVADILNIVVKNITEQCYFPREETKVFEDAGIVGRGLFNIYDDYDPPADINGQIVIEKFPWDECHFGPHEKEDLSDCDYVIKTKWFPLIKLKEMYPEKTKHLKPEVMSIEHATRTKSEDWDTSHGKSEISAGGSLVDKTNKQYKQLECWRKIYRTANLLINANDGFVFNADGWAERDISMVTGMAGFRSIPRTDFDMRVTKVISQVLLEDYYPELAYNDFHIIPLYAKKRKNKFWGKIQAVKDIQKLINKAYSQFVDILNKMSAYGWFYDDETFPNRQEEANFKKNASAPGFTQKLRDSKRPPEKVEGVKFPNEIVGAIELLSRDMREIMNVNLEMMGMGGDQQSGIAIRQKIVQQLLGNDFLFDNLSFAKQKLGKIIVALIQKLYTPERLKRIVLNQNMREPVTIGGATIDTPQARQKMQAEAEAEPMVQGRNQGQQQGQRQQEKQQERLITEQAIEELLQNQDLTKYDMITTESPSSPSAMLSNFMFLLEIAGRGVPIPPTALFQFAPIPNKEKILAEIEKQTQMDMKRDKMKYDTEIQKSLIAQQGKGEQGMM